MTRGTRTALVLAAAIVAASCDRGAGALPSDGDRSVDRVQSLVRTKERFSAMGARITVPEVASGSMRVADEPSGVAVSFGLLNMRDARIRSARGVKVYAGALGGADVVVREGPDALEDFVVFESPPPREELVYDVDVSRVAGLRLVNRTLEFLDADGTPRLRIAAPYAVDAGGQRHDVRLAVTGCALDTSPRAPWGRVPIPPGSAHCAVHASWDAGLSYPLVVDPIWVRAASMTLPRAGHAATLLASGKVLLTGAFSSASDTAELYDPVTATFSATGAMTASRYRHTATVLASGKVLVAGGGYNVNTAELYDPATGTFTATGSMATSRAYHTASILASGKVLVAGGGVTYVSTASAELYDPATGSFAAAGSMALPRQGHTASTLSSGKVLLAGGAATNTMTATADLYDPASGTFTPTGAMGTPRSDHSATILGSGKVLMVGGNQDSATSVASAELYDPATGAFTPTGSMKASRYAHTASLLGSGNVVVAGGASSTTLDILVSAEIYDAAAGTFAPIADMNFPHASHAATVLGSGTLLLTGSITFDHEDENTVETLSILGGEPCRQNGECGSGLCVDDRCCDKPCEGQCEACDTAQRPGTCVAVGGPPHPNHGKRVACLEGNTCNANTSRCEPPTDVTCDGDHKTIDPDGTIHDCAPFKCDGKGTCRTSCASVDDCVAPAVCSESGVCVAQSTDLDGACAVSRGTVKETSAPEWLAGLGALACAVLLARTLRRSA